MIPDASANIDAFYEAVSINKLNPFWYHLAPKGKNLKDGLVSPEYMYTHGMTGELQAAIYKYRQRICDWYMKDRDPASLTDEEVLDGLKRIRGINGAKMIYLFRFPPYAALGNNMAMVLRYKDVWQINLSKVPDIIEIDYGYVDSNPDKGAIKKEFYDTVSEKDYFKNYDDNTKGLLFAPIPHISVATSSGRIPRSAMKKMVK